MLHKVKVKLYLDVVLVEDFEAHDYSFRIPLSAYVLVGKVTEFKKPLTALFQLLNLAENDGSSATGLFLADRQSLLRRFIFCRLESLITPNVTALLEVGQRSKMKQ